MHETFDPTIIIFAVLAIFVLYKLRSVLGTRTGNERRPPEPVARTRGSDAGAPGKPSESNDIRMPGATATPPAARVEMKPADVWGPFAAEKAWPGLEAIANADPGFSAKDFLAGAGSAYEMIVVAFAAGDLSTLKNLLEKDVYESFEGSIKARQAAGHRVETTFVSLDKATIDDAQLRGPSAQVSVRFLSKLITATLDHADAVVDGAPDRTVDMVDLWTFARPISSRDPNWKLIATETAH